MYWEIDIKLINTGHRIGNVIRDTRENPMDMGEGKIENIFPTAKSPI